ncbi:porin family protein [Aquimarina sp. 2201CG5-10]|uniref:porin family protein n=1 Tax=Aquimarina callyspongiae TaxID=3098150 RepID=UPI002AB51CFC|nr:porin family protein [Aquimarina sp. 2201CG5-10]MDY8135586.1 porin family protein [Aquimarina sp. 2201CG5-10]
MKKLIFLATMLIGFTMTTQAQDIKFGVKGGVNFASLNGDDVADNIDGRTGFHLGAVLQLSLLDTFAVQPEVIYSSQGADFGDLDLNVDYLNVPILAKLKFAKFFSVEAGPQFGFVVTEGDDIGDVESFDFSAAVGAGVELGKFFGQLRYNYGITDVTSNGDVKNSAFQVSVGYYIF